MIENLLTKEITSFRDRASFGEWITDHWDISLFIGHNIIEFDAPQLKRIWGIPLGDENLIDTLILSRLYNPNLEGGHSLDAWGERLGFKKIKFDQFEVYSEAMRIYCIQDVKLTTRLYGYLKDHKTFHFGAADLEHKIAIALRDTKEHGFYFDYNTAMNMSRELTVERDKLDDIIQAAYPPTYKGVRVIKEVPFNANSAKQVIDKLWEAGWNPVEKTEGHKQNQDKEKVERFNRYGWKLNETNMATLPDDAPEAAKSILKRTIYETRIRKLTEWMELVADDGAIHGDVIGLGTWTHRMSHRHPNLANISASKSIKYRTEELKTLATSLGGRMRALWLARPGKVLVGTDAEGIQLRVLAHYMNDPEFTKAVTSGSKEDGTDPHSLNKDKLGAICSSRDNAKTFIYAFLLGAGDGKVGEIFGVNRSRGGMVKSGFIEAYPGLKKIKTELIPSDAHRGWTYGFDGRMILCESEHLMMAAYLQAGEAVIMKCAVIEALSMLKEKKIDAKLVNVVHDEMLFECLPEVAEDVRQITEESIRRAGVMLRLKCPMKGEGKIGRTWLDVH